MILTSSKFDQMRHEMEQVNVRQKHYYDHADGGSVSSLNSLATNLWRVLRQRAEQAISNETRQIPYDLHREWLGDLSQKKVLELGCGTGTKLTRYLARNAKEYHAIDLSEAQVGVLRERFGHRNNTCFFVGDFLSDPRLSDDYDVIYAHSVVHHFKHHSVLFDRLEQVSSDQGEIITLDPLQTWLPARMFRALFRPFQTDAAWEFPFRQTELRAIESRFDVKDRIGIFGRAKWAMALAMVAPTWTKDRGDAWFRQDFANGYVRTHTRKCLAVSYWLTRKSTSVRGEQ